MLAFSFQMLMSVQWIMEAVNTTVSTLKAHMSALVEKVIFWKETVELVKTLMNVHWKMEAVNIFAPTWQEVLNAHVEKDTC